MNWIQRALVLLVAVPAFAYLADLAVVSVRGNPTANITIKQYYAIPQKGNKMQYAPADSAIEECVDALFPHNGDRPCWYVRGHTRRQLDM
jgi:hypothetical protein